MRKRLGTVLRLLTAAATVLLFCYLAVELVLASQIRRGSQLLEEIQSVSVGDSETFLRPMLERFGGHRWDQQVGAHEDYNYILEVNPWSFPTLSNGKSAGRVHAIERVLTPRFRRSISLRCWMVVGGISIKQHRVVAVETETYVEGRRMWLGAMWRLSEKPREFERSVESIDSSYLDRQYLATPGILNMESGGGTSWSIWTTSSSPKRQQQMANHLNFGCLRSLSGCDTVCDLIPETAQFFSEHLELAPRGGGWDDSSRTCFRHDPRENQYW